MCSKFILKSFISNAIIRQSRRYINVSTVNGGVKPINEKLSYAFSNNDGLTLMGQTVSERLEIAAREQPNFEIYKFTLSRKTFTFLEVKQRVDELAQSLLDLGFKKGDCLALCLPNVPEMVIGLLAAGSIGVVSVLMNPAYQQNEVEYMLKKTKAKGILILDNIKILQHYDLLKRICPEIETSKKGELQSKNLPHLKHVIMVKNRLVKNDFENKNIWSYEEIEKYNGNKRELPYVDIDDPFTMLFTSGTTGMPKGTPYTNFSIVNSGVVACHKTGSFDLFQKSCIPIPIFHSTQCNFPHFFPDSTSIIKSLHDDKCTGVFGPPIIFIDLLNNPELPKHDTSSLQLIVTGASTVPRDLLIKIKESLKVKSLIIGYSLTESGCIGTITHIDDEKISDKYAFESIGRPNAFLETKVIDPKTNEIVPRNTDGELCIRGFSVMKGYYDEPDKTAECIDKNGWLRTGDIVSMDENGYHFFKSRAKEVVIRGGINIYPADIETFLRTNENVFDCYVVGVPDERVGEELCVWIKLKPNRNVDEQSIREYFHGKIANFKVPKYIKFVDSFPVNATGKVQKFKMQEQMKKELNL